MKQDLLKAKFYSSVFVDGATDCSITEKEAVYVLYFDPKAAGGKVEVKLTFLHIKDLGIPDETGIKTAIEDSFAYLGIPQDNLYSKLVGLGADGASVNSGNKSGVKTLLQAQSPWLLFQWCIAHCLELALRDALKETYFKEVDQMLIGLYYLYHKDPKKLFQLRTVYKLMKETL